MSPPQERDDLSVFTEKARKFDEADASFRALVDALDSYKAAIMRAAECGVAVAHQIDQFFVPRDREQKELVSKFLDSQLSIHAKWLSSSEAVFDADVLDPIKSRVDEIPQVRDYIKQRAAALAEMQKRQKKLQSERKRDGSRLRDKQRRLKEISDRYAMFHDLVIQRFNFIDRNMGTFVMDPLRSLVSILSDVAESTVHSLDEVVKIVAETPPITKELCPAPPIACLTDVTGGIVDKETWDDSYAFDDGNGDNEDEDEDETEGADTDSASARASGRRPPRGRVRSADAVSKGPHGSFPVSDSLGIDISTAISPRRGRSVSSTPVDGTSGHVPYSLPVVSPVTIAQRDSIGPGSSTGRYSQVGQEYFLTSVGTSAASSTSTSDNIGPDGVRMPSSRMDSYKCHRRNGERGSGDTVGSGESLVRNEVLMRVVALYDFAPQETNELEIHAGDVIEVSSKKDSGWWCGQLGKSKGYFPQNYTRELTEQEELELLAERRKRKRRGHRKQDSHETQRSGRTTSQSSVVAQ